MRSSLLLIVVIICFLFNGETIIVIKVGGTSYPSILKRQVEGPGKWKLNFTHLYKYTSRSLEYNKILSTNIPLLSSLSMASPSYKKYDIRKRNPDKKAAVLLVIDMQNYFYSMAKPILPAINTTIELCRQASVPVIFTRHRHKSPDDYGMLYEWWNGDIIRDGTVEAQLIPELDRRDGDLVVEKHTYSAFKDTNLEEQLLEMGIKEVIVSGVMTNLCCETTAREAFVRGFRVFFSTDATATSSAELHDATLKNLAYGFTYLVDCKRIQAAFSTS